MNNTHKKIIESLQVLADYERQKKTWLASAWPWSSFSEDICQLFDDAGLSHALKSNQVVFGKDADRCLHELNKAIDRVDQQLPPKLLLDHPFVQAVRNKATEALNLIALHS